MKMQSSIKHIFLFIICSIAIYSPISAESFDYIPLDVFRIEQNIEARVRKSLAVKLEPNEYFLNIDIQTHIVDELKAESTATTNSESIDELKERPDFELFYRYGLVNTNIRPAAEQRAGTLPSRKEMIKSVDVQVYHDEKIDSERIELVKNILNRLAFNLPVKVNVQTIGLVFSPSGAEEPGAVAGDSEEATSKDLSSLSMLELIEILSRFSTGISLIIFAFLVAIVSFLLAAKISKESKQRSDELIKSNQDIAMASQAAVAETSMKDISDTEAGAGGGANIEGVEAGANKLDINVEVSAAVQKFSLFAIENLNEACILVNKWLYAGTIEASSALVLLAKNLDTACLSKVLASLDESKRLTWREIISSPTFKLDVEAGAHFMNLQLVEEIMVPNDILSEKTRILLYSLTPERCIEIINSKPELGAVLFNSLSVSFISKIMKLIPTQDFDKYSRMSVEIELSKLKALDANLQKELQRFESKTSHNPFTIRISELLPQAPIHQQSVLLSLLAQKTDRAVFKDSLLRYFPLDSISALPDEILKMVLSKLPQKKLINLLIVSDDKISERYLEIVAPEGSNKREVIDFEMSSAMANELDVAKLKKGKDEIEQEFLVLLRRIIVGNPMLDEQLAPVIDSLYTTLSGNKNGNNVKMAA
jgi:hypothetical protein